MAIEIVSFPIEHGEFPVRYVNVYQRVANDPGSHLVDSPVKKWRLCGYAACSMQ